MDEEREAHTKRNDRETNILITQPAVALAFGQRELQRTEANCQERKTKAVDMAAPGSLRIAQKQGQENRGDHSRNDIDIKTPAPRRVINQETAQRWA